ncbi:MAG: helix-turn-helix transcriptional regulator [Rhodobacteraceae bacterium]|nr:helix-turn-helix transcriptional regulator [Paracoccaceae bacterium]
MLSHEQIWIAIDGIAKRNGLSPSGLAKRAGLDPTTFNRSKRVAPDGRPRWPSTESLAKILEATGETLEAFVAAVAGKKGASSRDSQSIPLITLSAVQGDGFFSPEGAPVGNDWGEMLFPGPKHKKAFALQITSNELSPLYRRGDTIVVAPHQPLRKGDRVVVKARKQGPSVQLLERRTADGLDLKSPDTDMEMQHIKHCDIEWTGRIIWASQ